VLLCFHGTDAGGDRSGRGPAARNCQPLTEASHLAVRSRGIAEADHGTARRRAGHASTGSASVPDIGLIAGLRYLHGLGHLTGGYPGDAGPAAVRA
jgi:hypothetical protein